MHYNGGLRAAVSTFPYASMRTRTMFNQPALLLRIEDAALFAVTLALYHYLHFSWILFAVLFLAPDLFMLGYLLGTRRGAALYNVGHSLFVPLALFAVGNLGDRPILTAVAVIWCCHITFDRMLGFGLKYPSAFKDTHLQHLS